MMKYMTFSAWHKYMAYIKLVYDKPFMQISK